MHTSFDFDQLCRLAQEDPAAFEAQRQALFEQAFAEMPSEHQAAARVKLAEAQVRMAAARTPAERLALAMRALSDSVCELQRNVAVLCGELVPAAVRRGTVHAAH
jgi:hypothetical protein